MKILSAIDMGADGVELIVWLDESRTIIGPDGADDVRPDPSWIWRATVPADQWSADQTAALTNAARLADREIRRRAPQQIAELAGVSLDALVAAVPAEEPAPDPLP